LLREEIMRNLLLIAALFTHNSQAFELPEDFRVNFSIASEHSNDYRTKYREEDAELDILGSTTVEVEYKEYFDEQNPGIGGEMPLGERSYVAAGVFDNSLPGTTISVYVGIGYDLLKTQSFALCAEAVIASGYDGGALGGDLCARMKVIGDSWIKLLYAPGESFDFGTDVYAIEYQIVLN
jgi:hypothetical protein